MRTLLAFFVLFCLCSITSSGQLCYKYFKLNGLCSTSYSLYLSHYFFYEGGCEERSKVSIGTWSQTNNIIQLDSIGIDTFNVVKAVSYSPSTDSFVLVRLWDIDSVLIWDYFSKLELDAKNSTGATIPCLLSENGTYRFAADCRSISIPKLSHLLKKDVSFNVKQGNRADVYLKMPRFCLSYPDVKWGGGIFNPKFTSSKRELKALRKAAISEKKHKNKSR
ncbi:MAG: hypothetical protein JSS82_08725 [Bacteroidetes bacterium]|nr:hypothetical protein [Bacteroidota bacterium]